MKSRGGGDLARQRGHFLKKKISRKKPAQEGQEAGQKKASARKFVQRKKLRKKTTLRTGEGRSPDGGELALRKERHPTQGRENSSLRRLKKRSPWERRSRMRGHAARKGRNQATMQKLQKSRGEKKKEPVAKPETFGGERSRRKNGMYRKKSVCRRKALEGGGGNTGLPTLSRSERTDALE